MSATSDPRVTLITGRALPMTGDDIDTDRIMPARFLKAVSFDGLERHVFEDDRLAARAAGAVHPFDDERYRGATVLVTGRNFGCGSSREHAPQGMARWGIRAVVGVSFAEIFFSNATALGVACVSTSPEAAADLARLVEQVPGTVVTIDLPAMQVRAGTHVWSVTMPASVREALTAGTWDATAMLTADFDVVRATAARLPYIRGF
ncbi:MAG: 3-isopropylmalate dehydratase small subunit [Acidobacteriota bacterium]